MTEHAAIGQVLTEFTAVSFALLIGSRATGHARADSDWDVALWIPRELSGMARLSLLEEARCRIATTLDASPSTIDVIDLAHSGLAMRAVVANDGLLLKQDQGSIYNRFLNRTWRELEEFNWEAQRAA